MRNKSIIALFTLLIPLVTVAGFLLMPGRKSNDEIISYIVDPKKQDVQFYWNIKKLFFTGSWGHNT
jgi:hypothetical protein